MENSNLLEVPPHVLKAEEAHVILNPHLGAIGECIDHGFNMWVEITTRVPSVLVSLSSRSRASMIFDAVASAAEKKFYGDPRVVVVRKRGSFLLVFEGRITLRFKKLNKSGRTSNIATNQQALFSLQSQLELPNMPALPTNVTAGYQFDLFGTRIQRQGVRCSYGNKILWEIPLTPSPSNVLPNSLSQADGGKTTTSSRVSLKKNLEKGSEKPKEG